MSHAYRLSALKLLSDIELPELMPWDGGPEAPPDLYFRLGDVPLRLDAPDRDAGEFQTKGRGQYLTSYPDEARVLVENGCAVTVDPAPGIDLADARAILMAPVQAVLWHQRGLLPLHASVVGTGGRAVALAGPSGAGKSTLAAALAGRGLAVLADDLCIVDAAHGPDLLPSTPRLRLWRDALDHLGIGAEGLPRALSRSEKYVLEGAVAGGAGWDAAARWRLASVVLLARRSGAMPALERLRGARAMAALHGVVHMLAAARALGVEPAIFRALARLAGADLTVWRLVLPDDRAALGAAAAKVAALLHD